MEPVPIEQQQTVPPRLGCYYMSAFTIDVMFNGRHPL